jgi:hypothetical protein
MDQGLIIKAKTTAVAASLLALCAQAAITPDL